MNDNWSESYYPATARNGIPSCRCMGLPLNLMENTGNKNFNKVSTMHTFSAKERDTETGLSYFGSRYYSSDLSIWLSVDPMSGDYPSTSPYVYCRNNPIILFDPNGMSDGWVMDKDNQIYWDENATSQETTKTGDTYLGMEGQHSDGTTVRNYYRDGSTDLQQPVIIDGNSQSSFDYGAGSSYQNNQTNSSLEKVNKLICYSNISVGLPLSATKDVLKEEAKVVTKNTSRIVLASKVISKANLVSNIVSVIPSVIRVVDTPSPENFLRLASCTIGASLNFLPGGVVFSILWNSIDASGGFDKIYNKFK